MTSIVTSILSILAYLAPFLIEAWTTGTPARIKEKQDAERQKVRNAIATGDVAAVNSVVDRLLSDVSMPTTGTASDSPERQHSDASIAERLNNVLKP